MLNANSQRELTSTEVTAIKECAKEYRAEIEAKFPNQLLREDVLDLLEDYCKVVYYPLEKEANNGFHIADIPDKNGNLLTFVFINTAQTLEKQIFTAAHELGHIWRVDDYVAEKCNEKVDEELSEKIMNQFAAELLIPEEVFQELYNREYDSLKEETGKITLANMLKVIVSLMNQFCVPEKAIVMRCFELHKISAKSKDIILGETEEAKRAIDQRIKEIIRDNGYIKFQNPTNKKYITDYPVLLEQAGRLGTIAQDKIDNIRKTFEMEKEETQRKMDDLID